jgi:hypothetical protein
MTFKMILWGTLVFFQYGSQLQVGTALLLCVGRLALHAQFEPYRMITDNAFDYVTLIITALFGLGGIMLQSMETYKNFAIYRGDDRGSEASKNSIYVVELVLHIMVVIVFVVFAAFWLQGLWLKRKKLYVKFQRVVQCVGKWCPCVRRCARRCCPKRCCGALGARIRLRATMSPSSPLASPATPAAPSVMDVEMTPQGPNRSDGGARDSSFSALSSSQPASVGVTRSNGTEVGNEGGLVGTNMGRGGEKGDGGSNNDSNGNCANSLGSLSSLNAGTRSGGKDFADVRPGDGLDSIDCGLDGEAAGHTKTRNNRSKGDYLAQFKVRIPPWCSCD